MSQSLTQEMYQDIRPRRDNEAQAASTIAQVTWVRGIGSAHTEMQTKAAEQDLRSSQAVQNLVAAGFTLDSDPVKQQMQRNEKRQSNNDRFIDKISTLEMPTMDNGGW